MQKWDVDYTTQVEDAREADTEENRQWRELCGRINVRDDCKCRACHRRVFPRAITMLHKPHHHHIVFASQGGPDTMENVCTLCSDCHDAVHVKRAMRVEGDAQVALAFFRLNAQAGSWYLWRQESRIGVFVEVD